MKLIILPGNAKANEEWLNGAATAFADTAPNIYKQRYDHWGTNQKVIDLNVELQKLTEAIQGEKEYRIFAKSAGALLALYGIHKGVLAPERCVFVGLPVEWAQKNQLALPEWLVEFKIPTVILQQTEDPLTPFKELEAVLAKFENKTVATIEIPGNDHDYSDFSLIKQRAEGFLFGKESEKSDERARDRNPEGERSRVK